MNPEKQAATISPNEVLSKAMIRAGDQLKLSNVAMAQVLGVSPPTISRMRHGEYVLEGKPFELAALFLRIFRSLDAIVGGDAAVAAQWMQSENLVLKDKPINLIQKVTGLFHVIQYLDSRRAIS